MLQIDTIAGMCFCEVLQVCVFVRESAMSFQSFRPQAVQCLVELVRVQVAVTL
jgi:hypothetical protein